MVAKDGGGGRLSSEGNSDSLIKPEEADTGPGPGAGPGTAPEQGPEQGPETGSDAELGIFCNPTGGPANPTAPPGGIGPISTSFFCSKNPERPATPPH